MITTKHKGNGILIIVEWGYNSVFLWHMPSFWIVQALPIHVDAEMKTTIYIIRKCNLPYCNRWWNLCLFTVPLHLIDYLLLLLLLEIEPRALHRLNTHCTTELTPAHRLLFLCMNEWVHICCSFLYNTWIVGGFKSYCIV